MPRSLDDCCMKMMHWKMIVQTIMNDFEYTDDGEGSDSETDATAWRTVTGHFAARKSRRADISP